MVRVLLEQFLDCYKSLTREKKKQLLQLLLAEIQIKQCTDSRSRTIDKIKIEFDFSVYNQTKTFTLIHMLNYKTDNDYSQTLPASDNKMPPYLQLFLPLFVVRFPPINPKPPIHLL